MSGGTARRRPARQVASPAAARTRAPRVNLHRGFRRASYDLPMSNRRSKKQCAADVMQSRLRAPTTPWKFRLVITEGGKNEFVTWDRGLGAKARAKRDPNIRFLSEQPCER